MDAPIDINTVGIAPTGNSPTAPRPSDASTFSGTENGAPAMMAAASQDHIGKDQMDGDTEEGARVSPLIRPYAMTGGRTTSSSDISLESQIQTSTRLNGDATKHRWEEAKILRLAERPMALVEIAARAEIPIGVARVVISDLVEAGAINVQRNAPVTSYTSLLEKVLDGIRDF